MDHHNQGTKIRTVPVPIGTPVSTYYVGPASPITHRTPGWFDASDTSPEPTIEPLP